MIPSDTNEHIRAEVATTTRNSSLGVFYNTLFERYGDDARALGHADRVSQYERFEMMARLFAHERAPFSVHEIGCALGHFGEFLRERYPLARFSGSDIQEPFVERCRRKFPDGEFTLRDITAAPAEGRYDYVVTCLFNCPGETPHREWQGFVYSMLSAMYTLADRGIATTCLTTYYDPGRNRPDLHYQDEKALMDFAAAHLSRHFVLDMEGPLYEYGLRVYRPAYVRRRHPAPELSKYFKKVECKDTGA
jgi:hypothetical protein